ncbi:MAG: hypothetical protein ACUVYA_19335, partial [Planctomycetota bacterium]
MVGTSSGWRTSRALAGAEFAPRSYLGIAPPTTSISGEGKHEVGEEVGQAGGRRVAGRTAGPPPGVGEAAGRR